MMLTEDHKNTNFSLIFSGYLQICNIWLFKQYILVCWVANEQREKKKRGERGGSTGEKHSMG